MKPGLETIQSVYFAAKSVWDDPRVLSQSDKFKSVEVVQVTLKASYDNRSPDSKGGLDASRGQHSDLEVVVVWERGRGLR